MASRTISVDDEAYALLKAAKVGDESFSDVVKRTLSPARPKLTDLAGILTSAEGRKIGRSVRDMRNAEKAAEARRHKRLWG